MDTLREIYTYDANGRETSYLQEVWSNGQWVNSERWTYAYDANGWETSSLREYWLNGQGENSDRYTFTHDANGCMTSYLVEMWLNGQWVNSQRVTYTYDANGRETSSLAEVRSNGQWVNSARWTYAYDTQENVTSFCHYIWLNSSWTAKDGWFSVVDGAGYQDYYGSNLTFIYRIIATGVASQSGSVPAVYSLSQNYPNPFNPSTTIRYGLPNRSHVTLTVFSTLGQRVALLQNGDQDAGYHEVKFDGSRLSSGIYFYRIEAGSFVQTRTLVLLK